MARVRLKVYRARMGFADTVVAAPNQKAALAAWGARQDLFAEHLAGVEDDEAAVAVALAHPGEVLRRPAGSDQPYRLGTLPPPQAPAAASAASRPKTRPPRPRPDRSALDAAEAELRDIDRDEKAARAGLARRRAALDAEEARLDREIARRRQAASRQRDRAQDAFEAASGGEDA